MWRPALKGAADILNAVAGLAWPLLAGLLLWRLFPSIKKIAESRAFTVKIGQAELTVQEALEKSVATTADIQEKLASVASSTGRTADVQATPRPAPRALRVARLLWVDDVPANNAYEAAQLAALGVDVVQATSTREGLAALFGAPTPFDAVISDMGRAEASGYNTDAGIDLIRQARDRGFDGPLFIYASGQAVQRRSEILDAGANGVTASPTELFQFLREVGPFPGMTIEGPRRQRRPSERS
jgi:CheY-like chemotaxis protein